MRPRIAHRATWALATLLGIAVVVVKWSSGEFDIGWLLRAGLLVAMGALVAIGYQLRERELDEEVALELLAAKGIRLHRETDSSH